MIGLRAMQGFEVLAIDGKHDSIQFRGVSQNSIIRNRLFCLTCFKNRQHIMAQATQFIYNGKREILVGI